jgi:LPXTG-site transpeptidase (sortase) family protein
VGITVPVSVVPDDGTPFANTSGNVSHVVNGTPVNGNTASDTLVVNLPIPGITMQKQVGLNGTIAGPWFSYLPVPETGQVYYLFVVENTGEAPLSNVVINDPGVNTASCVIPKPLPVASDDPDNEDHIAYCIVGPIDIDEDGEHPNWTVENTATASGTFGATPVESEEDSAIYAVAELTLVKAATEINGSTPDPFEFENAGDEITYTFTVTNTGSAILSGPITVDDSLSGIEITCPALTAIGNNDSIFDPGEEIVCEGTYTITEDDVLAGSVTNTATASSSVPVVTSDEDSVTVDGRPPTIGAVDDDFSGAPINGADGGTTATVFTNDTLNGAVFDPADVTTSITNDGGLSGVSINADGTLEIPAGTPAGDYTVTYEICEVLNPDNCDTAEVLVCVSAPTIDAVDDDFSGAPINGADGGTTATVFINDTLNGAAFDPADVTTGITDDGGLSGVSINADGTLEIPAGTPAGDYIVTYEICEVLNPTNCDTAEVLVRVSAPTIDAVDDDFSGVPINGADGGTTATVFTNDTLNGAAFDPADVTTSITNDGGLSGVSINADGTLEIPAGTPAGDYTVTYEICEVLNPDNCDAAEVLVRVSAPSNPALAITKTANPTSVSAAGDVITYTLEVENIGNVDLTTVFVSDPMLSNLDCDPILPGNQNSGLSLAVGESMTCTGTYTVTQQDIDTNGGGNGILENTATAGDNNEDITETDDENVDIQPTALIGAAKRVVSIDEISSGTYDVTYEILVRNYGTVVLNSIQVTDNLAATFSPPTTFAVQSLSSLDFSINPSYDGDADTNLLTGSDSLAVDESGTITLVVRVIPTEAGPFSNTAVASGTPPAGDPASDQSQAGTDPDPDEDSDPTNNNEPTPLDFGPNIFDPPIGRKVFDDAGLPLLEWTMIWINNSNIVALDARVSDPIPPGTTYVASGASSGFPVPAGAPAGSTNVGVNCYAPGSLTTSTSLCYYEGPTGAYPLGRIIWEGALGPDFGAANEQEASNELYITFRVNIPQEASMVFNAATISADLNGDGDWDDQGETDVATAQVIWRRPAATQPDPKQLPATGFAPGVASVLPSQPDWLSYTQYNSGSLVLEIPSLNLRQTIVGVPFSNGTWDVTWLDKSVGYLNGTTFPGLPGNSVLTGHVYLSNGLPGPFLNISSLRWGDKIILEAYGYRYVYEVRESRTVLPGDVSIMKKEDRAWLTLVTCKGFNETTGEYAYRSAVRAVLLSVEPLSAAR